MTMGDHFVILGIFRILFLHVLLFFLFLGKNVLLFFVLDERYYFYYFFGAVADT